MPSQTSSVDNEQLPSLTSEQREWLKRYWGNEFKFLLAYELSIYKDEDRLKGRRIMDAFIEGDKESHWRLNQTEDKKKRTNKSYGLALSHRAISIARLVKMYRTLDPPRHSSRATLPVKNVSDTICDVDTPDTFLTSSLLTINKGLYVLSDSHAESEEKTTN